MGSLICINSIVARIDASFGDLLRSLRGKTVITFLVHKTTVLAMLLCCIAISACFVTASILQDQPACGAIPSIDRNYFGILSQSTFYVLNLPCPSSTFAQKLFTYPLPVLVHHLPCGLSFDYNLICGRVPLGMKCT